MRCISVGRNNELLVSLIVKEMKFIAYVSKTTQTAYTEISISVYFCHCLGTKKQR